MEISFSIPNFAAVLEFFQNLHPYWYLAYSVGVLVTLMVSMGMCYDENRPQSQTPLYGWQIILLMIFWPIWFIMLIVWGIFVFLTTNHLKGK